MALKKNCDEPSSIFETVEANFKSEIVKEIMRTQFSNSKMKITEDVLSLINDISKAIVVEAAIRAAKQATVAGKKRVQLEHVEAILPQMMLDLP